MNKNYEMKIEKISETEKFNYYKIELPEEIEKEIKKYKNHINFSISNRGNGGVFYIKIMFKDIEDNLTIINIPFINKNFKHNKHIMFLNNYNYETKILRSNKNNIIPVNKSINFKMDLMNPELELKLY